MMSVVTIILSAMVAAEFFYMLYLETFATTSTATVRVFNLSQNELKRPSIRTLFQNQGVYNGLLAVLILLVLLSCLL